MIRRLAAVALAAAAFGSCAGEQTRSPTPDDVAVVDRALVLLEEGRSWDRSGDRDCEPGAQRLNLFCALEAASLDVLGSYQHRRPALEKVREVIEEESGRDWPHRLQDFNNDPGTEWADIRGVLTAAREDLLREVEARTVQADVRMVDYTLVLLRTGDASSLDSAAAAAATRGHFESIGRLEASGLLLAAGPVSSGTGDGAGSVEGIYLLRRSSDRPIVQLLSEDPAVAAGLLVPEVMGVWLPAGLSWPNPKYPTPG